MDWLGRHAYLASAIAGRKIPLRIAPAAETFAFSDGVSITVPIFMDDWRCIAAQAALIAAGSFDAPVIRQLIGRGEAADRYIYLEGVRAGAVCRDRLPQAFTTEIDTAGPLTRSADDSLAMALGPTKLPDKPAFFGTIKPLLIVRRAVAEQGLSALTGGAPRRSAQRDIRTIAEEEPTETSALLKMFQNPFSKGGPLADLLNTILGAGINRGQRAPAAGANAGELPVGRIEQSMQRGINAVRANWPFGAPALETAVAGQTLTYPEWNVHTGSYRPDYVRVETAEPWRPDDAQGLKDVVAPPARELHRQLATLGLDPQPSRRQQDGADLDTPALIEHMVDFRAGHAAGAPDVYRATRRTRRDLAVVIALDISGSTGDTGAPVFRSHVAVAYQLGGALAALGDRIAIFGFHSWGHKLVRIVTLKDHAQSWGSRVTERFRLLEPSGYTRTGAAIRHGTRLLQTDIRLPHRLLILITDGIPYDQDYENSYAESDTSRALQEAAAAGTACVCLAIGADTDRSRLAEIFGAANILAVDDPAQITGRIRVVCAEALARAALAKGSAPRTARGGRLPARLG